MVVSFTFKEKDAVEEAKDIKQVVPGLRVNDVSRPLTKPYTRHKVKIPGRAGTWDFGGGVAEDYSVTVDVTIVAKSSEGAMLSAKAMQDSLEGKKLEITFTDQTSVTHTGQLYEAIMMSHDANGKVIRARLVFECDGDDE